MSGSVNAAMIGLGFGAEFIPIYQDHPNANVAALCRRNEDELNKAGDQFGIEKRYTNYEDVLADPEIDFVHINSPIPNHAWTLVENEPHVIHTAKKPESEIPEKVEVPDFAHLLPEPIQKFTRPAEIHDAGHLSFVQGGGHGGSHPHLVHEFVTALLKDRDSWPNAVTSANWTCVGLCVHESAIRNGETVELPEFTLQTRPTM